MDNGLYIPLCAAHGADKKGRRFLAPAECDGAKLCWRCLQAPRDVQVDGGQDLLVGALDDGCEVQEGDCAHLDSRLLHSGIAHLLRGVV